MSIKLEAPGEIKHLGKVEDLLWHSPPLYCVEWCCYRNGLPYSLREIERYDDEPPQDIEDRLIFIVNDVYERGELFMHP
jgi:hypothetical protein